jgi:hypothetical protein
MLANECVAKKRKTAAQRSFNIDISRTDQAVTAAGN